MVGGLATGEDCFFLLLISSSYCFVFDEHVFGGIVRGQLVVAVHTSDGMRDIGERERDRAVISFPPHPSGRLD